MSTQRVGNYEIVRMLARGGMAVVYLVRQPALDREVVLKRLDLESDDPALAQRFVREARLAATLDHPNVVTLFDFFEHDGVPYIAMEYVSGGSLRELVGRLDLPQICGVVEGVLAGLGHAERRGIAHRDLKPENVLLTSRGNVKIADFGIARAYNALTQRLTVPGMAIGTPAYMAPEQATNDPLGPYTDLYALGVIAYELLSGRTPFLADTPVGLLYAHVHKRPPPLADLVEPGHVAVCGWVEWLLAKDPADRPQSAAEAWDALEEVAVAQMGPYWRRTATITAPVPRAAPEPPAGAEPPTTEEGGPPAEEETRKLPTPTPLAPGPPVAPHRSRRRVAWLAAAVGARRHGRGGGVRGARGPQAPATREGGPRDPAQRDPVRLRRRRPPGARDRAAAGLAPRPLGPQRRRADPRQPRAQAGLAGRHRVARRPARPAARGGRLRLRARQRRLRPRRLRGPGDRHAGPGARLRALRRAGRGRRPAHPAAPRRAARTCPPAPAATASCSWRTTSTGIASTTSRSAPRASATGSRRAARSRSSSAATAGCAATGRA